MSYASVFKPGGHFYDTVDRLIDRLPRGLQNAAARVFRFIVRREQEDSLATQKPTDAEIGAALGQDSPDGKPYSARFVQKGLNALDRKFEEMTGTPLINRQSGLGRHGRRTITLTIGLAPSGTRRPAEASPPQTPLEEKTKNMTTEGPSSSSSQKTPQKGHPEAADPTDPVIAELLARASALVPDVTEGILTYAVATYGADWVRRALGVAEERNRTSQSRGKHRVKSWSFVRGILENWRTEGGPPPEKPPPPPPAPKAPVEVPPPATKLLPEQLAALVEQTREGPQPLRKLAASQIRRAVHDGLVPAELTASIPAEILAGPEVPACGSS
jgi:hypothetical protein